MLLCLALLIFLGSQLFVRDTGGEADLLKRQDRGVGTGKREEGELTVRILNKRIKKKIKYSHKRYYSRQLHQFFYVFDNLIAFHFYNELLHV